MNNRNLTIALVALVFCLLALNVVQYTNSALTDKVETLNGKIETQGKHLQALIAKSDKQANEIAALTNKVEPKVVFIEPIQFELKFNWGPKETKVAKAALQPITQAFGLTLAPLALPFANMAKDKRVFWEGYMQFFGFDYLPRTAQVAQLVGGMNAPGFSRLAFVYQASALYEAPAPKK